MPGTTNRLLKKLAKRVLEAFPNSFDEQTGAIFTGNPVRKELLGGLVGEPKKNTNILVVGGSLGASVLNEVVPEALQSLQASLSVNVIHQAGKATIQIAREKYSEAGVAADIREFIADMKQVYQWADIVICRAGAMTISELAIMGLPSILVPLPHAIDDHQTKNAAYLADAEAAVLMPQSTLTSQNLSETLKALLTNENQLSDMRKKARSLAKPEATELVANACLEVAL